jgi:iron complex outermembrane receptor protein
VISAAATGDIFDLPAGPVGLAVGAEYRYFSLDDQPGENSQSGNSWGLSSAGQTKGDDNVSELFAEIEVPLLAGVPFAEYVTLNASARAFDYDSAGSDHVWKAGLNWQVNPAFRIRATQGTSYRAPALYELFLEDQTAFFDQLNDPCIEWGDSTNENLRANCSAEGIPADFQGGGSSGTIVNGGGAGRLQSETSTASTVGVVLTPTFLNVSIAVDYFEIDVEDQITTLGAGSILSGCYGGENFPNAFCDSVDRNPAGSGAPQGEFGIAEVRSGFINIDQQINKGIDLTVRYDNDFDFGRLVVETNTTWTFEDLERLFDPNAVSGFDDNDLNGTISRPKLVGNGRISLERGDWEYTWGMRYVRRTSDDKFFDEEGTFLGKPVVRVIDAERRHYHSFSVTYRAADWSVLAGVDNIFNTAPPNITGVGRARYGTVPVSATQYPLRGRTGFVRLSYLF